MLVLGEHEEVNQLVKAGDGLNGLLDGAHIPSLSAAAAERVTWDPLDDALPRLRVDRTSTRGGAVQSRVVEHENHAVGRDMDVCG